MFIQPHTWKTGSFIFISISRLKFVSTNRASHPSMPLEEITKGDFLSVDCGSDYRNYPSWFSPTDPGALLLDQICRNLRQCFRIWRQWWRQCIGPVSLKQLRHPMSLICHSPDGSIYLICYGPGGLGVWSVQLLRRRLVERGIRVFHALHCDVKLSGLLFIR